MHCTVYLIFMTLSWSLECAMHKLRNLMALLSIRISFVCFLLYLLHVLTERFLLPTMNRMYTTLRML